MQNRNAGPIDFQVELADRRARAARGEVEACPGPEDHGTSPGNRIARFEQPSGQNQRQVHHHDPLSRRFRTAV
jgi:hypothetical protein